MTAISSTSPLKYARKRRAEPISSADIPAEKSQFIEENYKGRRRFLLFLYWLAGVRKTVIPYLPDSERERIAVLGFSVLVPTIMAFIGMYLYASSLFNTNQSTMVIGISTVWAFIIMNIDRLLLATYRPFQKWYRKITQVAFRIGLAGFISVAIATPFCLDQYEESIKEKLRSEYRGRLDDWQSKEAATRKAALGEEQDRLVELNTQLEEELKAGPENPSVYAQLLWNKDMVSRRHQHFEQIKNHEKEIASAQQAYDKASSNLFQIDQDLNDEKNGKLSPDKGGTGLTGIGPKYKELLRIRDKIEQDMERARLRLERVQKSTIPSVDITANEFPVLDPTKPEHAKYITAAGERAQKISGTRQSIKDLKTIISTKSKNLDQRFSPTTEIYQEKISGNFDLMEKSIGLYEVIFDQNSGQNQSNGQKYKWIPGLFQFLTVFGTLFLLDLIAILSKILSRPGPYDVIVDFYESVSNQNIRAFNKEYVRYAEKWAENTGDGTISRNEANQNNVQLWDYTQMAQFLLQAHIPNAMDPNAKFSVQRKKSPDNNDNAGIEVDV